MNVPDWFDEDVSRETLDKLATFAGLLEKWTGKINLISNSTVDNIMARHVWDSAQIHHPFKGKWVDLGSGGGLPGVVIAILSQELTEVTETVLIESDQRKATFLRTCARELDFPLTVIPKRIEQTNAQVAQVVSARALSDLDNLLNLAKMHLSADGTAVFMKGARWQTEINDARKNWRFSCEASPSKTNADAAILRIRDIERA